MNNELLSAVQNVVPNINEDDMFQPNSRQVVTQRIQDSLMEMSNEQIQEMLIIFIEEMLADNVQAKADILMDYAKRSDDNLEEIADWVESSNEMNNV